MLLPRAWECPGGSSHGEWEPGSRIPYNREHGPSFCPSRERPPSSTLAKRGMGEGVAGPVLWGLFPFVIVFLLFP